MTRLHVYERTRGGKVVRDVTYPKAPSPTELLCDAMRELDVYLRNGFRPDGMSHRMEDPLAKGAEPFYCLYNDADGRAVTLTAQEG